MNDKDDDKKNDAFTIKGGRVINCSVFTKDQYNDKAVPSYKIEVAIPEDSSAHIDLENRLLEFADDLWGKGAGDDPDLVLPIISGSKLKKKREKKGKDGSAYEGMIVVRANTIYNKDGADAPGGIQVYDQGVDPIEPARQGEFYAGCMAEVGVVIGHYEDDDGNNALKFYLSAVQKAGEGEHLMTASDKSTLFKPVGRSEGGSKGKRRRRQRED